MEPHQKLSLEIIANDLRYVAGHILASGGGPRSWAFTQWGAMVAYEAQKHLRVVHDLSLDVDWDDDLAAAARHGGKFFDTREDQLDRVVDDFTALAQATHQAFYPKQRRLRGLDFLRDDLAVVTDRDELLLTNVTGHFMVGLPADRAIAMDDWGQHLHRLSVGIGQLMAATAGGQEMFGVVSEVTTMALYDLYPEITGGIFIVF